MTYRRATPEETKARFGKPLILFGVKPPASSATTSTSTAAETPEAVSQFLPWRPMPPDPTDGMERQAMDRIDREKIESPDFKDPSGVVTREEELKDGEMRIARFQHQNKEFLRLKEEGNKQQQT